MDSDEYIYQMNAEEYLHQTEDASRKIIASYIEYEKMLEAVLLPTEGSNEVSIDIKLETFDKYFGFNFSKATLCGSLLQIAFMGIEMYSKNTEIPDDIKTIINSSNNYKIQKFCIGRRVQNIPIGLLIYGGRNQYNHWDEEKLNPINEQIFDILNQIYSDDMSFDMVYELNYSDRTIKAHHIVMHELGWFDYDSYFRDMVELIL